MHPPEHMSTAMESWVPRHRITVDEYYRMAEVGLLAPDARVELIEGEIIDMVSIGPPHCGNVDRLNHLLTSAVGKRAIVRVQSVVRLSRFTEPQPDFVLLRPREDFYGSRHPAAEDTFLIIEISESSLRYDLEIKVALYARHGVPEVWIVDVKGKRLRRYRRPEGGAYLDSDVLEHACTIEPELLPGAGIDLAGILPP